MQALTLQKLKQPLQVVEKPSLDPVAGEVVVDLRAAGVNRRDYWITQGMYPGVEPPVVLGSDGAGVVSRCGEDVDPRWLGRDVIVDPGTAWGDREAVHSKAFTILGLPRDGTFATEVAVHASQLCEKPQHLNWQEAAALPLAGVTAYRALFSQGGLQGRETVLITGVGGGVATFALQFAIAAGADVWVTSSSPEKIDRAIALGARGGFDYKNENWPQHYGARADPPNLIIDSAGGPGYASLVTLAGPGGRIVNYGATAGLPEKLDLFKVFWKQLRLQGSTMGSPADFTAMIEFVEKHEIKPIIDATFPLVDGNEALQKMKSSPQFGKYVLDIV